MLATARALVLASVAGLHAVQAGGEA
jgi:hypothetical protein